MVVVEWRCGQSEVGVVSITQQSTIQYRSGEVVVAWRWSVLCFSGQVVRRVLCFSGQPTPK